MQASSEESKVTSSPSLTPEFSEQFSCKMKLLDFEDPPKFVEEDEDDEEEEEEFTFACIGAEESTVSAEDAFHDGQIKPVFPLFDHSLLLARDSALGREDLPRRPPVKKVFIEAEDSPSPTAAEEKIDGLEGENAAEMYCAWSGKAVEASPEICKKSNSTGFSKIWRFRELTNRSNSDGRDAFVFLNNNESKTTSPSKTEEKREGEVKPASVSSNNNESRTTTCSKREESQNSDGGKGKVKSNGKKKKGTPPLSAHELHYVRSRALREGERRRSYLPYRPELVGFFTNVNGGLSRNIHPF
ncbi:hypothetical protein RHMOL_Rhmol04G0057500 [Rhododendron molle]|uniref:Uncharacterized protein n=1 Tax=Rhododendron molle TaxID=49168 RepID=A0ACC0NXW0_RHOML|nr:hypothetical protein RHMOL_Rhmol04G0057500 [Rhododendron molle]